MLPDPVRAGYAKALEELLPRLPAPVRSRRQTWLDAFLQAGFPSTREEEWRYTDLERLSSQGFTLAAPAVPDLSAQVIAGTQRLVFVNGQFDPAASGFDARTISRRGDGTATSLEPADDSISQLNAALSHDGLVLRLAAGRPLNQPLHVLNVSVPALTPAMSHLGHSIELAPGADATVIVEDLSLGDGAHFLTQCGSISVGDNAQLTLLRLQNLGPGVQALSRWDARLARDASLDWINLDLGGGLVRNDLGILLDAPGARATLSGVYHAAGLSHIDNHTRIDHRQPHGHSRQTYRGIVDDRAKAVFNGKIVVHPNAVKTDSEQHVANLLLSAQAEVNAKPELQIDNDDVKCAHGATCGQLDTDALYYLRSRGLSLEAARQMLLFSFADAVLGRIEFAPARHRLRQRLLDRLQPGTRVEDLA